MQRHGAVNYIQHFSQFNDKINDCNGTMSRGLEKFDFTVVKYKAFEND